MYRPKVTLVNSSRYKDVVAEVYVLWVQSRSDWPVPTIDELNLVQSVLDQNDSSYNCGEFECGLIRERLLIDEPRLKQIISMLTRFGTPRKVFRDVIRSNIPVGEAVQFVWILEDIPVALREQLVRHREFRVHQQSSYWSQSSRCRPLEQFYDEKLFTVPDSIEKSNEARELYDGLMANVQRVYNRLLELGVPQDDARFVFPAAMTHRISFHTNLRNMISLFRERSCWVSQQSLWLPIISQMVQVLSSIEPMFRELAEPPCSSNGKFTSCPYVGDNELRYKGLDPAPACPLFVNERGLSVSEMKHREVAEQLAKEYRKLWPAALANRLSEVGSESGDEDTGRSAALGRSWS